MPLNRETKQSTFSVRPSSKQPKKRKPSTRKLNTACARCKRRHIKCDGGSNCANCIKAKAICEYVEADKKVVISHKHLTQLQDSISQLKHENANVKCLLKQCLQKLEDSGSKLDPTLVEGSPSSPVVYNNNVIESKDDMDAKVNKDGGANEKSSSKSRLFPFLDKVGHLKDESNIHLSSRNLISQAMCKLLEVGKPNPPTDQVGSGASYSDDNIIISKNEREITITIYSTLTENQETVTFNLPSYTEAITLLDTFIAYNDACFYFFNEGLLRENLKRIYDSTNSISRLEYSCGYISEDSKKNNLYVAIFLCKIMMMFSIAELYHCSSSYDKLRDIIISTESKLFSNTKELFCVLFGSERLQYTLQEGGIETLLLYSFYLQNTNQVITSHLYLTIAVKSAVNLGMHVDYGKDKLSRCELEHRRRLLWSLFLGERLMADNFGFSLTLRDCDITAELPQDFDMSCYSDSLHFIFPDSEIMNIYIEINKINTVVIKQLYDKKPSSNILTVIKEMVVKLLRWKKCVPLYVDCDYGKGEISVTRLIGTIMNEYFQGLNLAVRPLLLHITSVQVAMNAKEATYLNLSDCAPIILALLNASFQASMNSIRTFWNLYDMKQCFLKGYSDMEYLYTASSTLLLFSASFGVHNVTSWHIDHALTIMTRMKKAGNLLATLRISQILELISKLDTTGVMNDIVKKYRVSPSLGSSDVKRKSNDIQVPNKRTKLSASVVSEAINSLTYVFQTPNADIHQGVKSDNSLSTTSQVTSNSHSNSNSSFSNYFSNDTLIPASEPIITTTASKASPLRIPENLHDSRFSPFFVPELFPFGDKLTDSDLSAALKVFGDDSGIFEVLNI